jgi:hypothetical protein
MRCRGSGLCPADLERVQQLEIENSHLRRLVAKAAKQPGAWPREDKQVQPWRTRTRQNGNDCIMYGLPAKTGVAKPEERIGCVSPRQYASQLSLFAFR